MIPISTRAWIATGLVVAGLLVGWQTQSWRMSGKLESERASHAAYVARQQAASADVIGRTLLRERELREKIEENEKNAQTEIGQLERDLADSNAAASGMRKQLSDLSGRIGADSGTAAECAAARATAGVLAELLGESDQLAGAFAESADRNRVAGEACEAVHDAVRLHARPD